MVLSINMIYFKCCQLPKLSANSHKVGIRKLIFRFKSNMTLTCCRKATISQDPHLSGLGRLRSRKNSTSRSPSLGRRTRLAPVTLLPVMVTQDWLSLSRMWLERVCAVHCITTTWALLLLAARQYSRSRLEVEWKQRLCINLPLEQRECTDLLFELGTFNCNALATINPESTTSCSEAASRVQVWKDKSKCTSFHTLLVLQAKTTAVLMVHPATGEKRQQHSECGRISRVGVSGWARSPQRISSLQSSYSPHRMHQFQVKWSNPD